jgi:hypothetical protein
MMTATILFTLILLPAMIFLCEAWLEVDVIALKNPTLLDYRTLNKSEHFKSAVFAVLIMVSFLEIALYMEVYAVCVYILVCRRIFFEVPLRLLRERKWYKYEGDGPIDGTMKKYSVNTAPGRNSSWSW